ncbi:MAG: large conductance mechanosensitive channel protein MscL [Streptococcaceae bacterium]|jgi:large conductance mechanosensitive channel|nr:large conductance mechanosensitive channel protein MscL [Streptococcaceae bacterium]
MIKEFREFIAGRNVLDLAVGVIIGGALTTVVKSLVDNLINPLIGAFLMRSQLTALRATIGGVTFKYGQFLNDAITFMITAVIVFLLIRTMNKAFKLQKAEKEEKESKEAQLLSEIRDLLKK